MADRCPSTAIAPWGYRCTKMSGHAGEHINDTLSWSDSAIWPTVAEPCGATVGVQTRVAICTRPSGHDGAHGDGALLWCDPLPIPQGTDNTDDYFWED